MRALLAKILLFYKVREYCQRLIWSTCNKRRLCSTRMTELVKYDLRIACRAQQLVYGRSAVRLQSRGRYLQAYMLFDSAL